VAGVPLLAKQSQPKQPSSNIDHGLADCRRVRQKDVFTEALFSGYGFIVHKTARKSSKNSRLRDSRKEQRGRSQTPSRSEAGSETIECRGFTVCEAGNRLGWLGSGQSSEDTLRWSRADLRLGPTQVLGRGWRSIRARMDRSP